MIQDIGYGGLKNQYCNTEIQEGDFLFFFDGKDVFVCEKDKSIVLPEYGTMKKIVEKEQCQFLFCIGENRFFLARKPWEKGKLDLEGFTWENVRFLRMLTAKEICFAAMTAYQLFLWYEQNRYCGHCGALLEHDTKERMLHCPYCGNMVYPKIAPAVIVGVTNGDKILMTKYAGRDFKKYALIAGFVEIGETAEQTVEREVFEEVGLRVKNIHYYKSQPWGVDSNLLLGYFAEVDGSDQITMDSQELSVAEWVDREHMPAHDDGISLTREMMGVFEQGLKR